MEDVLGGDPMPAGGFRGLSTPSDASYLAPQAASSYLARQIGLARPRKMTFRRGMSEVALKEHRSSHGLPEVSGPGATVDLSLGHPVAQRLGVDPQLLTDPGQRAGTGGRIPPRLHRHPGGTLPQLIGVLPRCRHDSHPPLD